MHLYNKEQGRDIKVSTLVLDCISKTLQLNNDETDYLYDLAFETNPEITSQKKGSGAKT